MGGDGDQSAATRTEKPSKDASSTGVPMQSTAGWSSASPASSAAKASTCASRYSGQTSVRRKCEQSTRFQAAERVARRLSEAASRAGSEPGSCA